jgi:hypothetical protein
MTEASLTCANHPGRPTTLRCNRCEKPICSQCAVLTPVGYRCRECVRGQQAIFETAKPWDLPLAFAVSAVCVGVATALLNFLGFWGLIVAPVAGGGIAEIVRWSVRRRRSRYLAWAAAAGGAAGVLPTVILPLAGLVLFRGLGEGQLGASLVGLLWPLASGGLLVGTLYYRLRGIRI